MKNTQISRTRGQDQRDLCKEFILRGRKNILTRNDNNKSNAKEQDTDYVEYLKYVLPAFRCEDDYSADQLTQFDSVADYVNVEPIFTLVNNLAQVYKSTVCRVIRV